MAKGSQLSQLKTALSEAGLSRSSQPGKKRKRSDSRGQGKDHKTSKLQEIHDKLNPFDVKVTKLKHDVGGRKLKGVIGRPGASKQAGIDQRTSTLLKEYEQKDHVGGILDRRFGENDPDMTPEERMLERFTRERQRASKGVAFNLEDEGELTHYGQSLSKMDDFDGADLHLDIEDDNVSDGNIDQDTVRRTHFAGFDDEDEGADENEPPRKKTKAEVMAEVMAKSKEHKYQRQLERQQDDDTRHLLDDEFADIRGLLMAESSRAVPKADSSASALNLNADHDPSDMFNQKQDQDYDVDVRELALGRRAHPKDRTKTEEELASEAKEALEKAERKRLKRMRGEDDTSSDEEADGKRGRGRKPKRDIGGDDLEDDFVKDGGTEWGSLGAGLGAGSVNAESDEGSEGSGNDYDVASKSGLSEEESESEDVLPILNQNPTRKGTRPSTDRVTSLPESSKREVPFTFPCPQSHEEFLIIVEEVEDEDVPTIVNRIRTLYHPSLAADNKFKLEALAGVLIDYLLHVAAPPDPKFSLVSSLIPHLHALTQSYPVKSAEYFISKLKLMQKNLSRGLSKGALSQESKTWPGTAELALLHTIGKIWPTSDKYHHVVSPARLLMGAYLGLARIRCLSDLASGLFLCTLFLRYEHLSKRLVPEAVNFVVAALLHLAPHSFDHSTSVPGQFPILDFESQSRRRLRLSGKEAKKLHPRQPNLVRVLTKLDEDVMQNKTDLLGTVFDLLTNFAEMYKGLEAFIELFEPILAILDGISDDRLPSGLQIKLSGTKDPLRRLLMFSRQARRPLSLQSHKPIAIASYMPKFQSSSSSYLRRQDPDHERAAASRLRRQYKQERKGAVRELRKDARFLAGVKQKEQQEKDHRYKEHMNKAFGSLEGERAEQKRMDKEKLKEKKRAGRK